MVNAAALQNKQKNSTDIRKIPRHFRAIDPSIFDSGLLNQLGPTDHLGVKRAQTLIADEPKALDARCCASTLAAYARRGRRAPDIG
jgi:hypothetical protein